MIPKVADFYHEDKEPDFQVLLEKGVIGVFLKATEGRFETDPAYARRFRDALRIKGA